MNNECSRHMAIDQNWLSTLKSMNEGELIVEDYKKWSIGGYRDIYLKNQSLVKNILFFDGLKYNIINISQLCYKNIELWFKKDKCLIINDKSDEILLATDRVKNVFILDFKDLV